MTSKPSDTERPNDRKTIWVFTPSRTDPRDLEYILVQRQKLLQDAVERGRESARTNHKHHLLFVGPRGCGKTHLVTLIVSRLTADGELTDHLRIAWLNEDETCTTLLELLLKIHSALEKRYPRDYQENMIAAAYEMKQDAALEFVSHHLLSSLGSRTLLVVAENLDTIFEGLGDVGQKQLRAFIQEHPRLSIVATAQRLVEDLSNRTSPFFGFFQTEHLKPLNVEEATELLQNIARLHNKRSVVEFLSTRRGRSRVLALHHLSGGNHRIYIVLSQFITRDSIDALLEPFAKMVDELTPYYQERIRWLPPLQRKIVEYLCICEGTVPVKEIARRLFSSPQTISSQLQDLREKGYVEANQRGRESLYEISEPLMRICVEVKDNQRYQPLRLLVDFLRVWYDDQELKDRLGRMEAGTAAGAYLEFAIQRNEVEGSLRKQILLEDFQLSLPEKLGPTLREGIVRVLRKLPEELLPQTNMKESSPTEAISCLNEGIAQESTPSVKATRLLDRAWLHSALGDRGKQIEDYTTVIGLPGAPVEQIAGALFSRGVARLQERDMHRAIEDFTAVIGLPGIPVEQVAAALVNRGFAQRQAGNRQRAIEDFTTVIGLRGAPVDSVAWALLCRGIAHSEEGDRKRAIEDFTTVIGMPGGPVDPVVRALVNRGVTHLQAGETHRAIEDFTTVIGLPGASVEPVALALAGRGFAHRQAGDRQLEIDDYTTVIGLPGGPVDQVARALLYRGAAHFQAGETHRAIEDFTTVIGLSSAPIAQVVDAHLALSEAHVSEGRWSEGFQALEASLGFGEKVQPAYRQAATDLIGRVFSGGLSPDGRREKIGGLLRIYSKHQSLSVLGEGVVQHIGAVFRAGEPFPSTDNLEGWASAWEQEAQSVPDFRLSVRLLRTGINFLKTGGKDPSILLDLTFTERKILEQSLGLASEIT